MLPDLLKSFGRHARRRWLALVFVGSVLLHLPYLRIGGPISASGRAPSLARDEGTVLYDASRINDGAVMYRDFFQFQGPVFYLATSGLFAITGPSIVAARVVILFVLALSAAALALVVSRFHGRLAGIGAALIHGCAMVPFWPRAYPHWFAEALALTGLAILTAPGAGRRHHIGAGACFAGSLLSIQSVGLPILAAALGMVSVAGIARRDWKAALRPVGWVLAGAAIVFVVILGYFAAAGALDDLYYGMFGWTLDRYGKGQHDVVQYGQYANEAVKNHAGFGQPWKLFGQTVVRVVQYLPFVTVPAAIAAVAVGGYRVVRRNPQVAFAVVGVASLAVCMPALRKVIRADINHIAFIASFGVCAAAVLLAPLTRWRIGRIAAASVFGVVGLMSLTSYAGKIDRTWKESRQLGSWRKQIFTHAPSKWLDDNLPPGEPFADGSHFAGYRYFYIRPAAVSYTLIPKRQDRHLLTDAQWQQIADEIADGRPRALVLTDWQWQFLTKLRPDIAIGYEKIQRELYVRRE